MAGAEHEPHASPASPSPKAMPAAEAVPVPDGAPAARADRRMLTLLVCPVTRAELIYDAPRQELISRAARVAYPIRDGVPVMTPDGARPLDDDEVRRLARR